jgi:hypothetical protein
MCRETVLAFWCGCEHCLRVGPVLTFVVLSILFFDIFVVFLVGFLEGRISSGVELN